MNKNINFLFALLLADVLFDTLFLASVLSSTEEDEEEEPSFSDKHPLIGRRYKVQDNSYIKDLKTGCEGGLYGKETIIISDPYTEVIDFYGNKNEHLFVNVFSTDSGRDYRVLFNEGWLIDE